MVGKGLQQSLDSCGWRGLDAMTLNGLMASEGAIERYGMADWREVQGMWKWGNGRCRPFNIL